MDDVNLESQRYVGYRTQRSLPIIFSLKGGALLKPDLSIVRAFINMYFPQVVSDGRQLASVMRNDSLNLKNLQNRNKGFIRGKTSKARPQLGAPSNPGDTISFALQLIKLPGSKRNSTRVTVYTARTRGFAGWSVQGEKCLL